MPRSSEEGLFDLTAALNEAVANADDLRFKVDAAVERWRHDEAAYRALAKILDKTHGAVEEPHPALEAVLKIAQDSETEMRRLIDKSAKADRLVKELHGLETRVETRGGRTKRRRTKRRRTKRR